MVMNNGDVRDDNIDDMMIGMMMKKMTLMMI